MRDRLIYFFAYIAGSGLGLVKMLVVANQLAPSAFGTYSLAIIASALLSYVNSAGVFDAFLIQLNGSQSSAHERHFYRDSGMLFSSAVSLLTSVLAVIAYNVVADPNAGIFFTLGVILFLFSQNSFNILMIEVQAGGHSQQYAWLLTVKSFIPICVMALYSAGNDVKFFLFLDIATIALLSAYCLKRSGVPRPRNFSRKHLAVLIRDGAPFTGQNAVQNLAMNSDKWAVSVGMGPAHLGVYNLAAQLMVCGVAFASMIQVYFLPRVTALSLGGAAADKVLRKVLVISGYSLIAATLLFTIAALIASRLIGIWYPSYREAIDLLPVMAFAGILMSTNHADLYFRARRLGATYLIIQCFALAALLASYAWVLWSGSALWMYAGVLAIVRFVYLLVSYSIMCRDAYLPGRELAR